MTENQFYEFIAALDALAAKLKKNERIAVEIYGFRSEEDDDDEVFYFSYL